MSALEGRIAVVTGGGSGIGFAIAERFAASAGAAVRHSAMSGPDQNTTPERRIGILLLQARNSAHAVYVTFM